MSVSDNNPLAASPAPAPVAQTGQPVGQFMSTDTMRTSIFLPQMPGMDQGPPIPSALNASPSAFTLMRAFQRRWPLAIGSGLLAALLTLIAVWIVFPAKYVAFYTLKIHPNKNNAIGSDRNDDVDLNAFKGTQIALASNRSVILRALDTDEKGRFIKDFSIVRDQANPVEWLQTNIKTELHPKASELVIVKLGADQAEEVTLLVNALAKSLLTENELRDEAEHNALIDKAQDRAKLLENEIDLKRRSLNKIIENSGPEAVDQNKKLEQLRDERKDAKKSLTDKQSEITGLRTKLESLKSRSENPDGPVPVWFINETLEKEPDGAVYFKKATDAAADYDRALATLKNVNDPIMQGFYRAKESAASTLAAYQRQRLPEMQRKWKEREASEAAQERRKYEVDLASLLKQVTLGEENLARIDESIRTFQPKARPSAVVLLENEIESSDLALKKIRENIQILKVNSPTPRVSILQSAIEPNQKDTGRQTKLAGAGSLGMFLLAVLGVSFLEFRSRKITSSDEVKRGLGMSVIGTVPTLPEKARTPLAQTKLDPFWQNQLMESVDTIRTMLLHSARSNNTRVIMVTSAVGGEGKTSLSSQLAASLARAWKKTLLIDGDLRNPAAHKLFDVAQEPGLSEVLRGELTASEAVRSTPLSRLWVLPAGHWDSHAVQALAQDNVRTMLEEMKQQYDFIILDSCPVLPVTDSLLLGQNVDGVLMTVMRDVSRSPAVYSAQQRLEGLGIKMLGAVMIGAKNELGPLGYKYASQARPQ
jgi:succinoglycan biosynthesis transport protein ExoP